MERFIKLHTVSTGNELWLRVEGLAGFTRKNDGAALFSPNDDGEWVVTETPEQVLALIEQRPPTPTANDDGCCDVCGRDLHGCAACSGYVDPENIRETRRGENR